MIDGFRPMVSCIMIAGNNLQMIRNSISYFMDQNYPYKQLIIIDDGDKSLKDQIQTAPNLCYFHLDDPVSNASKRNFGIAQSRGEIIMHWDDQDWYAPDWLSRQTYTLLFSQIHIIGLQIRTNRQAETQIYAMAPATLCYLRSFWDKYPIKDIETMEDAHFVKNSGGLIYCHTYSAGYLEGFHEADKNISFENREERIKMINRRRETPQPYQKTAIKVRNEYAWVIPVTCILCTQDGQTHLPLAMENLLRQDYPDMELLILQTGPNCGTNPIPYHKKFGYVHYIPSITIGELKNRACEKANGEIILHWDEQNTYAQDWITQQVSSLVSRGADASGLDKYTVQNRNGKKTLMVKDPINNKGWAYGATLVYWKRLWKRYKFRALDMGEDDDFLHRSKAFVAPHDYTEGFIANIGQSSQTHL
ncbi:glycosyltransferase family 2 protein [Pedobacter gandavensis]|uniref:glycosyltransferase family A protein n=1 Tax=Pedobacter gandavensis TaxID=2679963 RepID=UPI00292E7D70|nr:glycosyltransferase family 2 protein [Pedobacter gandavensis]